MLSKVIIAILLIISIPLTLVIGALIQNDLPWSEPPGFTKRLHRYITTHVAETTDGSLYPELTVKEYAVSTNVLSHTVQQAIAALGWELGEVEEQQDKQLIMIHAVVTTPLFAYQDDVRIQLSQVSEHNSRVSVRSVSREGNGDLGTNTRHILNLYEQLSTLLKDQ